jgi:hypothetical protein
MKSVNFEFHNLFTPVTLYYRDPSGDDCVKFSDWFYFIGSRYLGDYYQIQGWNCKHRNLHYGYGHSEDYFQLPKHYWKIKELY